MSPYSPFFVLILSFLPVLACGGSPQPAPSAAEEPGPLAEADAAADEESYEASLRRLAASEEAATRQRAKARLAIYLRAEGRLDEASAALSEAAADNPLIGSHILLQLAEVELERGNPAAAVTALRRVISEHGGQPAADAARIQLPATLAAAGDPEGARAALPATRSIKLDELNDEAFAGLAAALSKAGMTADAANLRMRILQEYPSSRWTEAHFGAVAALPAETSPLNRLTFSAAVELAARLGSSNRYDQSLEMLDRIRKRWPDQTRSADFRLAEATALFNSRNYTKMTEMPSIPGEAHYLRIERLRAHAYWRSERPQQFLDALDRLIRNHPSSTEAASAKLLLSKYYQTDETDLPRSARLLEEAIAKTGTGPDGQHLWNLAWTWVLAEEHRKALQTFERYLQAHPDDDYTSNALFWSAKVHEKLGNPSERDARLRRLISFYPYTYYSYRAREILGDRTMPPASVESGLRFPEEATRPATDPRLAVARELREIGLDKAAAAELRRIATASPDDKVLAWRLADFYAEAGEPLRAIILLNRHFSDLIRHGGTGIPRRFWEVLYPRMHWEEIQRAAARVEVDPWLAMAVIRQESGWDPTTVSSAGAVGLMQIMPKEAASIARTAELGEISRSHLFDPVTNIRVGTAELRQKMNAMDGHPVLSIASYNAGETAVRRWLGRTPIEDLDRFVDSIPYAETRLYVMTVTRNLHEYRRVYGES